MDNYFKFCRPYKLPGPRELYAADTPEVRPGEVVLVLLLLTVWAAAVAVFLRKWRSIRILQPGETRFKHAPKNLETIKVYMELGSWGGCVVLAARSNTQTVI